MFIPICALYHIYFHTPTPTESRVMLIKYVCHVCFYGVTYKQAMFNIVLTSTFPTPYNRKIQCVECVVN